MLTFDISYCGALARNAVKVSKDLIPALVQNLLECRDIEDALRGASKR